MTGALLNVTVVSGEKKVKNVYQSEANQIHVVTKALVEPIIES